MAELDHETHVINRFLNAREKAEQAARRLANRPAADERLFYSEQYRRLEAEHARAEMVRRLKMWAWNEGHDSTCPLDSHECEEHLNPYVVKNQKQQDEEPAYLGYTEDAGFAAV